ncbi:cysteine hydrolase [Bordetella tumbae]
MKTALILLDYIVDIMHPSGKVARSAAQAVERGVVQKANMALAHARANGWLPILVKVGFRSGYNELSRQSLMFGKAADFGALQLGGPGTAFHPDLQVQNTDCVIVKPRISAFYSTGLEALLRAQRIERLVIAGVSTTWAVQATARDAHDRDYQVVVLEDACAAAHASEHGASIHQLATIAQIIRTTDITEL